MGGCGRPQVGFGKAQPATHVVLVRETARFELGEDELPVDLHLKAACTKPRKNKRSLVNCQSK